MRELLKICQTIQLFELSWCVSRLEGMNLVRKDIKWSVFMCHGQTGKNTSSSSGKMGIFPHLALFFLLSLPKSGTLTHL